MEQLYTKNLYPLALQIVSSPQLLIHRSNKAQVAFAEAQEESADTTRNRISEITRRYADYLHEKGEYAKSVTHYISTIGSLEPSYVIRKFLDAGKIANLSSYLAELHQKALANMNHTTLLLNCYAKLEDVAHLDEFIESDATFDVPAAIAVCRQGKFFHQAARLAQKHSNHELYLQVQIEDLHNYPVAIEYLGKLDTLEIINELALYGYILVSQCPERMTSLLLAALKNVKLDSGERHVLHPDQCLHFFINQPVWCARYLEGVLDQNFDISLNDISRGPRLLDKDGNECVKSTCNVLLQLFLSQNDSNAEEWGIKALLLLKHPFVHWY